MEKWEQEKENTRLQVTEHEIADVVSTWTKIPVRSLEEGEAKRLMNLENVLHERVVGQQEAVTAISQRTCRLKGSKASNRFFLVFRSNRCWKNRAVKGTCSGNVWNRKCNYTC